MNERAEVPAGTSNADATRFGDSPTGLDLNPRPPRTVRVSKRAAGTLMAIAALILGLFAYGGYQRQQRQVIALAEGNTPTNVAPATAAGMVIAKDIPSGNLPTAPPVGEAAAEPGQLVPPNEVQSGQTDHQAGGASSGGQVFVRQAPVQLTAPPPPQPREPSPEERRLLAAYEQEQQAIAAPTTLRTGFGASSGPGASQSTSLSPNNGSESAAQFASMIRTLAQPGDRSQRTPGSTQALLSGQSTEAADQSDQNLQDRKVAFLANARNARNDDYLQSTRTAPLSPYEIKAGWELPAVLEQALNSDLPGELKALVSSNVYDTATGRFLLIPQGARLVGEYNPRIGYGQDGVQVIWNRVIYPDGSSLDLSGMVGQDAHGYSGFRDKVDRHYRRLVGFAVLTSLFAAASEIARNRNRSLLTYPSPSQIAGSSAGQQAADLGAQITRRNLNVQPTIKIPIGYRFNVSVNRDILFDRPYEHTSNQ